MDHEAASEWPPHGTLRGYLIGLGFSLVLSVGAYLMARGAWLAGLTFVIALLVMGVVQAAFQLYYFLHVGQERHPRWGTVVFSWTVLVIAILMVGTLWIMTNLNERVMPEMGA
jgi:cytochrome o ubiquinol oxidase subunit IV